MMTSDVDSSVSVRLMQELHQRQAEELRRAKSDLSDQDRFLKGGGGDGISGGMDGRVSKLEAHMEHVREDVREIKDTLGQIITKLDRLNDLPTKADLASWKLQWSALAFAVVAIVIGGIIGGLSWIQPTPEAPSQPQPIVIQVPK